MRKSPRDGFTLIELLVVIGIIGVMIGLLLPVLGRVRAQARYVQCQSNLHQLGVAFFAYGNHWRGAIFPPWMGGKLPVNDRWPVHVFKVNPPAGSMRTGDWTPRILKCPNDPVEMDGQTGEQPEEVAAAQTHTYILNGNIPKKGVKFGSTIPGRSPSEVVVAGEKRIDFGDYYVGARDDGTPDYPYIVEPYRHGLQLGSNHLYLDGHVGPLNFEAALGQIDPWDFAELPKIDQGSQTP